MSMPIDVEDLSTAFHISIAWTLGAPSKELLTATEKLGEAMKEINAICLDVREVKAKIGNGIVNMPLKDKVVEGKGLF